MGKSTTTTYRDLKKEMWAITSSAVRFKYQRRNWEQMEVRQARPQIARSLCSRRAANHSPVSAAASNTCNRDQHFRLRSQKNFEPSTVFLRKPEQSQHWNAL